MRDFIAAARNFMPVARSVQSILSRVDNPFVTSSQPYAAFGERSRVNDGFRRSQSTNIVLAPVCAVNLATAAAMLDFPSLGTDDVNPMTLPPETVGLRSIATLTDRMASAKAEKGESIIVANTSGAEVGLFFIF